VIINIQTKVDTDSQASANQLLNDINSPLKPGDPQPNQGMCQSVVLAVLCNNPIVGGGGWTPVDGCTTILNTCVPPTLDDGKCLARNASVGAFVIWRALPNGNRERASYDDELDAAAEARAAPAEPPAPAGTADAAAADGADAAASDKSGKAPGRLHPNTIPRPRNPKQAQWVGCCVTKRPTRGEWGPRTCKRIRVGKKFENQMTKAAGAAGVPGRRLQHALTMNPMRQLKNCQCFAIREYVYMDMFTRKRRRQPKHLLAPFPFSVGVTTQVRRRARGAGLGGPRAVGAEGQCSRAPPSHPPSPRPCPRPPPPAPTPQACVPNSNNAKACTKKWMQTGAAEVSCNNGAITVNFTTTVGAAILGPNDVKVTCDSDFSTPSSCNLTPPKGMAFSQNQPNALSMTSQEWNNQCICPNGRRPIIIINVPEIVVGDACPKKKKQRARR
jgi:hypothetical protein